MVSANQVLDTELKVNLDSSRFPCYLPQFSSSLSPTARSACLLAHFVVFDFRWHFYEPNLCALLVLANLVLDTELKVNLDSIVDFHAISLSSLALLARTYLQWQWGFRQCLLFSWTTLLAPNCRNGSCRYIRAPSLTFRLL